ncbi:glycosyltransferase [Ilumatobacter sp.]|uniref:glycosyltransferase n=1 Tax=Ilumatobacter sp. TaxID=1967498 RepID=UPI003B52979D
MSEPGVGVARLRPVEVFVSPNGNAFMRDIADWLVEAAALTGRQARIVDDRLPGAGGTTDLVVAPHEFYALRDDVEPARRAAARRSIPICTEQPGTTWFEATVHLCAGSPLVVDINEVGAAALEREGFDAHRLRLGGVPSIDRRHDGSGERPVDVVFLGAATDARAAALSRLAPVLWQRRSEIRLFSFGRPITGDEPGVVFGADKYDLLARSKLLVNLHRGDDGAAGYFEWARMVESMANGCVVVTEPSIGHEPLVAGEHFVETTVDRLADDVVALLDDPDGRARIAARAHRAVMVEHPLVDEVATLLARIEAIGPTEDVPVGVVGRLGRFRGARRASRRGPPEPLLGAFEPHRGLRRAVYDQLLAEIDHARRLGELRSQIEHGTPDHVAEATTPAWSSASAEVTAVVTLHDYADVVVEALDSLAGSHDVELEVVVVDDGSRDGGPEVVLDWMAAHPDVAVLLLSRAVNRGLTRARNLAISRARAELVMVVDADNQVYPSCLRRLADALDHDRDAAFAYSTLEAFGAHPGLRSAQGWHVPWLCERNHIDAQAMIRRDVIDRLGGYRVDDATYGWEDWDLWLRIAAEGGHGVHVPEMLGRYRTQPGSMHSLTNLAAADLRADLIARHPDLPWPERTATGPPGAASHHRSTSGA